MINVSLKNKRDKRRPVKSRKVLTIKKSNKKLQGKYSSLLLIECDASKLESQSINLGQEVDSILKYVLPGKYKYVKIDNKNNLFLELATLKKEAMNYDVIFMVGHSNAKKIILANNFSVEWSVLPGYLDFLHPKCLVLAACEGGKFLPSHDIFEGIKSLKEIYGSPVKLQKNQLITLKLLILYLLYSRFKKKIWQWGSIFGYLFTGAIILRHTRQEYIKNKPYYEVQQSLYDFLQAIYKKR